MGQQVEAKVFSREDRQRYRQKVRSCLDVFARMLAEARFDADAPLDRPRDRAQPDRRGRRPGDGRTPRCSSAIADPDFVTELGQFNIEINIPPRCSRDGVRRARGADPRRASTHAEDTRPRGGRAHDDRRHPADGHRAAPERRRRWPRTRATSCSTSRSSPPAARTSRSRSAASSGCRRSRTRSPPRRRARASSCTSSSTPSDFSRHWNAAQAIAGVQLAVGANSPFFFGKELWRETRIALFEQADGHAPGGAQGPGRAPARVVRRALDHVDLRPVRGERPLLPGAAARVRRRGPGRGARPAATSRSSASSSSTTGRSTAGTGRSTTSSAGARTCAWRTACCRPGRRSSTSSPTPPSTTASSGCSPTSERPIWSQMSFSAAEENFHAGARDGIDARVYWPGVGEVPVDRAGAAPPAADGPRGPRALGRSTPPTATGCSASSSAAASTMRNGATWQAADVPPPLRGRELDRATRCAR